MFGLVLQGAIFLHAAESKPVRPMPVPAGWKVATSVFGDLNNDRIVDVAMVIQRDDPKLRIHNNNLGQPELDTNPRRLIILAGTGQGYREIAHSEHLIPSAGSTETPCLEDPLAKGGLSIARGVLSVNLHYWLSCGSYGVTVNTYKFQMKPAGFRLIGYDRMEFMRSTGLGKEASFNFLTRRKSVTPFAIDDSVRERLKWSRIDVPEIYLESIDLAECLQIDATTSLC